GRYADPYYWAAFIPVGDERPLEHTGADDVADAARASRPDVRDPEPVPCEPALASTDSLDDGLARRDEASRDRDAREPTSATINDGDPSALDAPPSPVADTHDLPQDAEPPDPQHPVLAALRAMLDDYRADALRDPDARLPGLANNRASMGTRFSEGGEHKLGVAAMSEAVGFYRILAARDHDAFGADLADCLNNLGISLGALGQKNRALAVSREAVDLNRALAARNPERHNADLAQSLYNLSFRSHALDQHSHAVSAARESVDLFRMLAARDPETFQPQLTDGLNVLGVTLATQGQH